MTEGADVSDNANLSVTFVGADPCVRPGNVNRVNHTIRFIRDKRTYNSAHKNTSKIKCFVPVLRADTRVRPYGVTDRLVISETSAPSVISQAKCHLLRFDGGGFKWVTNVSDK